MKTYSRKEIRHDQWEILQLKAYASLRFLRARLIEDETTDEEDIVETVDRILQWENVLSLTCRLLGSSSEIDLQDYQASLWQDPSEHQVDHMMALAASSSPDLQ
jgi:hypothetical protein